MCKHKLTRNQKLTRQGGYLIAGREEFMITISQNLSDRRFMHLNTQPFILFISQYLFTIVGLASFLFSHSIGFSEVELPPGFTEETVFTAENFKREVPIAEGYDSTAITTIESLPDGRVFIGTGDVRGYLWDPQSQSNEERSESLAFPIFDYVTLSRGEIGVLGCVPAPDYMETGEFFVSYAFDVQPYDLNLNPAGRRIRVERFKADFNNKNAIIWDEREVIFDIPDEVLDSLIHFGGGLEFGPDGHLYLALGDDSLGLNSNLMVSWRGKILRMNREGKPLSDNPFYFNDEFKPWNYIWALGLRNPYRLRYSDVYNTMYCSDTGQSLWEEINVVEKGGNYGWPALEGPESDNPGAELPDNYIDPWYSYPHGVKDLEGFAIVSMVFYDGTMFPQQYQDRLIFSDWGAFGDVHPGTLFMADIDEGGELLNTSTFFQYPNNEAGMSDLSVLADGSLLIANTSQVEGSIRRISYQTPDNPPLLSISSDIFEGEAPLTVNFSSELQDESNIPVRWDFGDYGTSVLFDPVYTFTRPGVYQVIATATDEFRQTTSDTLTISVFKQTTASGELLIKKIEGGEQVPVPGEVRLIDGRNTYDQLLSQDISIGGDSFDFGLQPVYQEDLQLLVSAPGLVPRIIDWDEGGEKRGVSEGPLEVFLSASAVSGRVLHQPFDRHEPWSQGDLWISLNQNGVVVPYELPDGIDFSDPLTPAGYPSGLRSLTSGNFYFPVDPILIGNEFQVTANLLGEDEFLASQSVTFNLSSSGEALNLFLEEITPALNCEYIINPSYPDPGFERVKSIFNQHCVGCHGMVNPYQGLNLTEGFAYSSLVNIRSKERPDIMLVEQADPSSAPYRDHYLFEKVNCGRPSQGSIMPPTGKLTGKERRDIYYWIAYGAKPSDNHNVTLELSSNTLSAPAVVTVQAGAEDPFPPYRFVITGPDGRTYESNKKDYFLASTEDQREFEFSLSVYNREGRLVGRDRKILEYQNSGGEEPDNLPPVILADFPESIDSNALVVFDFSESEDPDGTIIGYLIKLIGPVELEQMSISDSFQYSFEQPGSYEVIISGYDEDGGRGVYEGTLEVLIVEPNAEGWHFD